MKEQNDTPIGSEFQDSQSDSQDVEADRELVGCDGFTDEAREKACKIGNRPELHDTTSDDRFQPCFTYILASGERKHFCKASHLVQFLLKYHTTKGKPKKQKTTTKNKPQTYTTTFSLIPSPILSPTLPSILSSILSSTSTPANDDTVSQTSTRELRQKRTCGEKNILYLIKFCS